METKTQLKIKSENAFGEVFTSELIDFLVELHENFNQKRFELLDERKKMILKDYNFIATAFSDINCGEKFLKVPLKRIKAFSNDFTQN